MDGPSRSGKSYRRINSAVAFYQSTQIGHPCLRKAMPSISRQYHPQSCSLEITAQTSPLSRWAKRPILKSVNFLLSFRGLSGQNHEPLEVRGNHEQLQLLSETVTHYVQNRLGQSLATSPAHIAGPEPEAETQSNTASQLSLYPRSLVTHDLVLGPLATNANHQTISLKASQLFDLVSALDDCTAELEVLPASAPSQRPAIPVWASSAAVIVLILGVSTATLQLTQQQPESKRDWVTASDKPDDNSPTKSADKAEGIAAIPKDSTTETSQPTPIVPSPPSSIPLPETSPSTGIDPSNLESPAQRPQPSPSIIASAPRPRPFSPPTPAKPKALNPPPISTQKKQLPNQSPPPQQEVLGDQKTNKRLRESVAVSPADSKSVRPQAKLSVPPPASAPAPAAEPEPASTADTIAAGSDLHQADNLNGNRRAPDRALNRLGRQAPTNAEAAYIPPTSVPAQNIRQYFKQRWQVPSGLTQPLRYQLTLNTNGSLKQVTPLDNIATQYLDKVPLPRVNQPFIAPLKPSQSLQVQLILKPDGTMQILEGMADNKAP